MKFIAIALLVAVSCGDFLNADETALVRIPNFEPQKGVTAADGVYILGSAQDTVLVAKLDLQATSVIWLFQMTLGNHATAVDITAGQNSIWLAVNVLWNKTETIPGLMSSENPRVGTWNGLLVSVNKAAGTIEWTKWMGGCLGADSFLNSVTRARGSFVAAGFDNCMAGLWLGGDSWSRYITGKGGCQAATLSASDQSVYLATACLDDIGGALHPQPGKLLPTLFKLSVQGDILWARIFPAKSSPYSLQVSAVTIMPLTSLDYIALFVLSPDPSLMLADSGGTLQWAVQAPFSSISGLATDASKGIAVTSSNSLIWYSYDSVQRASRSYPSGSLRGPPLLLASFDTLILLFASSDTMYDSVFAGASSAVAVRAGNPFAMGNCTSVCNSCFAQRSDSCFDCNSYLAAPFACGACHSSCKSCFGPDRTMCRSCADNFQLAGSECILDLKCPLGKYTDQTLLSCQPCHSSCIGCSGAGPSNCTSCAAGLAKNDKVCVAACPAYRVNVSGLCIDCALSCASCSGVSAQNCTKCPPSNFLFDGQCLSVCPVATFTQAAACVRCVPGCAQCASASPGSCALCLSGYFALDGDCVQQCPPGTVGLNGVCAECPVNCTQCADPGTCTVCADGFFWDKPACKAVPNCPMSAFFNGTACLKCDPHCDRCWGAAETQCYSCKKEFFWRNSTCVEPLANCSSGFFLSSNNTCEVCSFNCSSCLSTTRCLSCRAPLVISEGSCLVACPSNSFQVSNSTCVHCGNHCEDCSSSTQCRRCGNDTLLSAGGCVPACPADALPQQGKCVPCGDHCAVCSESACSACVAGFYLSQGLCAACPAQCALCASSQVCSGCQAGFHLYNSSCVLACPAGWADVQGVCAPCHAGCERCESPNVCTACEVSVEMGGRFVLQSGVCDVGSVVCYPGFTLQGGVCIAQDEQYSRDFLSAAVWLASV